MTVINLVPHDVLVARATRRRMLADLVDRAFDGSASALMLHLLDSGELDPGELGELRRIIDHRDRGRGK